MNNWSDLVTEMGLSDATRRIMAENTGQGDSVKEQENIWGDLSVFQIGRVVMGNIGGKEIREWVAEHVMGFERKHCQGATGGTNISGFIWDSLPIPTPSSSWFYCDWCGMRSKYLNNSPCPSYPFPEFTIIDLANKLAQDRWSVFLKRDAWRDKACWTVMVGTAYRVDVNDPLEGLCYILWSEAQDGQ